jgi:hypothetical protein
MILGGILGPATSFVNLLDQTCAQFANLLAAHIDKKEKE